MRFGRPRVRWFRRDGCLSAEERIAEGGRPGVGGVMNAELLAVLRCMSGEGSDFCGGHKRAVGVPGDEEGDGEEDITVGRRTLLRLAEAEPSQAQTENAAGAAPF